MWCNPPVNGSLVTSVKPTCPLGREEVNFSSFSVSTGSVLSSGEKILEKECSRVKTFLLIITRLAQLV